MKRFHCADAHRFTDTEYIGEEEVIAMGRLVINGEEVYELDEECLKEKYKKEAAKKIYKNNDKDKKYKKDYPK